MIMKIWSIPEISELNINETANGFIDHYYESQIVINDKKATPIVPEDNPS